jgi:hypothetical protein
MYSKQCVVVYIVPSICNLGFHHVYMSTARADIQRRGSILSWMVILSVMAQTQLQLISPWLR